MPHDTRSEFECGKALFGARRKRALIFLAVLLLWLSVSILRAGDCASQNIYFPLGNGFSWSYRCTAVDDEGSQTFTSRVVCTLTGSDPSAPIGRLVEVWSGLKAAVTITTPVKLVGGAVFTVEPTMLIDAPQVPVQGTVADKSQAFQLYLPAMSQLAVGAAWSRTGGFVIAGQAAGIRRAVEGIYQQADTAQVLGLDAVSIGQRTVAALKVQSMYKAMVAGAGSSQLYTLWFAPGIGLVKEMAADGSFVRELTSCQVTPCCGFVVTAAGGGVRVNGKPVALGQGVNGQAKVSVPQGSTLDLAAGDGSRMRVEGGTEASLEVFCDKSTQAPDRTVVSVVRGLLLTTVAKIFSGHNRFEVHTPSCIIGVRGTEFSVEVRESAGRSQTIVEVTDGEVWVRRTSDNREVILRAGSKQIFE